MADEPGFGRARKRSISATFRIPCLIVLFSASALSIYRLGRALDKDPFTQQDRQYWAFQKVRRPQPPKVRDSGWVRNPVDRFVLAALESKGIPPSPRADKITLIRRAYLDLTGLPPAPEEVDAFLADKSPGAFSKVTET